MNLCGKKDIKKLYLLLLFLIFQNVFSQQIILSENTKVSILTVETADESYTLYGHTALRINDLDKNLDLVYNYGMFDFDTDNFILKFAKGDLNYFVAATYYADFEFSNKLDNRSIYEQCLNLSQTQKQQLFDKLNTTISSSDRYYNYKFIDRNCTTKIIDVVNDILENKPISKQIIDHKTYREVLNPYTNNHFFWQLGINIIFGQKCDNQAIKLFLPFDLYDNLKVIKYKNKPLVTETKTLFDAKRIPEKSYFDTIYFLIAIVIFFVFLNKKVTNCIYFSALGLVGLLISGIGLYSFHEELFWNYNALLFSPLYLILVFFILKKNSKWIVRLSWVSLGLIAIYFIFMLNKIHLSQVLSIIIGTVILLIRLILKHKPQLLASVK